MKKFYSIVLMATALLIGTNMQAESVSSWDALRSALEDGGEVTLSQNINVPYDATTFKSILIGAKNQQGTMLDEGGNAPADAILNLAGHNITIDATNAASHVAINPFVLTKGSLKVTGTGTIEVKGKLNPSSNVFFVFGAKTANASYNPKGDTPFSHLEIDKNVTVQTKNGTVIAIDALTASHAALTLTDMSGKGYDASGMAFGVFVDVKGTLISEGADYTKMKDGIDEGKKCYGIKINGLVKEPSNENDKIYIPYVYVEPSAVIRSDMRSGMAGSTAIYSSGYGQWLIKGNCSGATGVYISSGIVAINDATVKSAADTYNLANAGGHANGSGSAIVINSRENRPGDVVVTISGDTKAESTSGYALEEIVNTPGNNTRVQEIAIEGGSFEGGKEGAIVVTTSTVNNADVKVNGGQVIGESELGKDDQGNSIDLATYLNNNQSGTHATMVEDEKGNTVLVITKGDAPEGYSTIAAALTAGKTSVKLTGASDEISGTIELAELEINEVYTAEDEALDPTHVEGTPRPQVLTIADGATFEVGRVVLGSKAQIVVEAGAKLIVTGKQGIVAPVVDNIVLKNEEGKRSIFLFNPAVTSNRHPNATVELITNAWWEDADNLQWELFGIPTHNAVKSITCEKTSTNEIVYAEVAVFENASWTKLGYIGGTYSIPVAKLNQPFAPYDLIAYCGRNAERPKVVMTGELVGNENADLDAYLRWTPFANSYTAELDLKAFLTALGSAQHVAQGIYVAQQSGKGKLTWNPVDLEGVLAGEEGVLLKLQPMQAFMLNNPGTSTEVNALNYKKMVYNPAMGITSDPAGAPRRIVANSSTSKLGIFVSNEEGLTDKVTLRENANNIMALEKYMNDDVNIYAMTDEKKAIVNAENIENTYVGFSTVQGGKFTISFANVVGREFDLIDHETGARVAIAEGNTYEFNADANSANDYRFEIVDRQNMPTAIDKTEAVKSVKGIYTITGQYVGEMNVWNTLPAGVYVVNGEKRVK